MTSYALQSDVLILPLDLRTHGPHKHIMLFKRRRPEHFFSKLRVALWPRRNWLRSAKYIAKRVLRLSASPHVIAIGFATGVFASFTPFIGFHFLICFTLAWLLGGNLIASALGTFVGNPITFPFIWIMTYKLGNTVLTGHDGYLTMGQLARMIIHLSYYDLFQIMKPMLVGGLIMGPFVAMAFYFLIRRLVAFYQRSRLAMMARKAEERVMDKMRHLQEAKREKS